MNLNKQRLYLKVFGVFCAYNVFIYLFSHAAYLFDNAAVGVFLQYLNLYVSKISEFILFPIISVLMLVGYVYSSMRTAVLIGLSASAARVLYAIPYYYLEFYEITRDSAEAILLSGIRTLLLVALTLIFSLLLLAAALLAEKIAARHSTTEDTLASALAATPRSDFLRRGCIGIAAVSAIRFIASLCFEIIDTVSFFSEHRYDYRWNEILTIAINYVLLLALLIASYVIASRVKNYVIEKMVIE